MLYHFENYEYRGYRYEPWEYEEDDNAKLISLVKTPEGKEIHFDWSPYNVPTKADFCLWIDLGCPDRNHPALGERFVFAPLDREDLRKIQEYLVVEGASKALEK